MKPSSLLKVYLPLALVVFAVIGCSNSGEMTKEQEEAMRHPKVDPNWKPATPENNAKMAEQINAYREKHKNDEVKFVNQ